MLSLHEMFGQRRQARRPSIHILDEHEIVDGIDELGVLLYGHAKNAYWYGSQLSIEETRALAPYQNATGLQVTSAVLAGMVWALENPKAGIVEADEMDFRRCLEVQTPYLGPVDRRLHRLDAARPAGPGLFPEDIDTQRSLAVPQRAGWLARRHREERSGEAIQSHSLDCFFIARDDSSHYRRSSRRPPPCGDG